MEIEKLKIQLVLSGYWLSDQDDFSSALLSGELNLTDFDKKTIEAVNAFQKAEDLKETGKINASTEKKLREVVAKIDRFAVIGIVSDHKNTPLKDIILLAHDKDLRTEQELGKSVTNQLGEYAIFYDRSSFTRAEKGSADLILTATDQQTGASTSTDILFNAPHVVIIDLQLDDKSDSDLAEDSRYLNCLKPVFRDVSLHELTEDDIKFLAGETQIPSWHLKYLQLDTVYSRECQIDNGVFYAWMRQGLPTVRERLFAVETSKLRDALKLSIEQNIVPGDVATQLDATLKAIKAKTRPIKSNLKNLQGQASLSPSKIKAQDTQLYQQLIDKALLSVGQSFDEHFKGSSEELQFHMNSLDLTQLIEQQQSVKEFLRENLNRSGLSQLATQEGLAKINTLQTPDKFTDILQPDAPLQTNPLFQNEILDGLTFHLGEFTGLRDETVEQLIERDIRHNTITQEKIDALVDDGVLEKDKAQEFGLNANLYQLTDTNLDLVKVIKERSNEDQLKSLRNLTQVLKRRSDWETLLKEAQIDPPGDISRRDYAALLHKQIEILFPHDVFRWQHQPVEADSFDSHLGDIQRLFEKNENLFQGIPYETLKLEDIPQQERESVKSAYHALERKTNRYPGLELDKVLDDRSLSSQDKLTETIRRVNLLESFYDTNENVSFLSLSYVPDSEDIEKLDLNSFSESDKNLIVNSLKANQRVYRVTQDVEHAHLLMESGYSSSYQVIDAGFGNFVRTTGIAEPIARYYYESMSEVMSESIEKFGLLLDYSPTPLSGSLADNTSPDINRHLRRLDGYSDLFGSQDYCKCKHCQSILSPAAYFADLMGFLKINVLEEYFTGINANHPLNPKIRRSDLWNTLPLTCECTLTLVPYLTIILEILENYIATKSSPVFDGDLKDRIVVEEFVYRKLNEETEIHSIQQPFFLPLVELETYLEHFSISRSEIAETLLMYEKDSGNVVSRAVLNLSLSEYRLIMERNSNVNFIRNLYRITGALDFVMETKHILQALEITREELSILVNTRFVTLNGSDSIRFEGRRRDGDPDFQPDMEFIVLTASVILDNVIAVLERMHRFVRLWRKTDWSMQEVDQLLYHIYTADIVEDSVIGRDIPLPEFTQLYVLKNHLKVSVLELCTFFDEISVNGTSTPSFFDQLFNHASFSRAAPIETPDPWLNPETLDVPFKHAAYHLDLPDPEGSDAKIQHRLLAGLNIDDDDLIVLIDLLGETLAQNADGKFNITLQTLTLLYRHARLAKLYGLSIPELFALIRMSLKTGGSSGIEKKHVENFEDLIALNEFVTWQNASDYTIKELALMVGDLFEEDSANNAIDVADQIIQKVDAEQSLLFTDTVFAYIEGVTEAQSQALIKANSRTTSTFIEAADIQIYRVSNPDPDPDLLIPASIADDFTPEQQATLIGTLQEIIAAHQQPGAPDIPGSILAGTLDLSVAQSRAILAANDAFFVSVENLRLFWLTHGFYAGTVITIPDGIPLRPSDAHALLMQYSAPQVIANQLSTEFGIPIEKVKALALLAGFDFSDESLAEKLTRILHRESGLTELEDLIEALFKLTVCFQNKTFNAETLAFIQRHSGRIEDVYHTDAEGFRNLTLATLQQIELFRTLFNTSKTSLLELFEKLFDQTTGFDYNIEKTRFRDGNLDDLTILLGAERGLMNSINQTLGLPRFIDPASGDLKNQVLQSLHKLKSSVALAQRLGIGGEALSYLISDGYNELSQAAAYLITAIRTKYEKEQSFQGKIEPFEDKIREQKRDALTDYIIHNLNPDKDIFRSSNDLYHYFLIDTELEGCARTSKVVAGIASLQLYIQRVIMNLEQTPIEVDPGLQIRFRDGNAQAQWAWRKNYRVWEANRKVFLFPENYLEPDLRHNKTPLFEEFEAELLQQEINAQSVLDAYARYIDGFEEIAKLKIAGAYHDRSKGADVLHLFGVTSSEPPIYYYRTIENIYKSQESGTARKIVWNAWRKIGLQIPVKKVSPIVFKGRLYVFWVEITTRPKNVFLEGTSRFDGYKHSLIINFSWLQADGSWIPPQAIKNYSENKNVKKALVISDDLASNAQILEIRRELMRFSAVSREVESTPETPDPVDLDEFSEFVDLLIEFIQSNDSETFNGTETLSLTNERLNYKYIVSPNQLNNIAKTLFIPEHSLGEFDFHFEPKDEYTLTGFKWDRIYPFPDPRNTWLGLGEPVYELMLAGMLIDEFQLKSHADLNEPTLSSYIEDNTWDINTASKKIGRINVNRANEVWWGKPYKITTGLVFADAVRYLLEPDIPEIFTRQHRLFSFNMDSWDGMVVNGVLTDCIFNVQGDLLYVHSLKNADISEPIYGLKRLGSTLTAKIERVLFEKGVDKLLSIKQQQLLQEAVLPVRDIQITLANEGNHGILDFKGSLGIYFREIFFHIPLLIANHLNSQGKYTDAQRWYHYIFDPTSNNIPTGLGEITDPERRKKIESDRVWQFIEFRNRDLASLREQLDNPEAIHAYENDPFNPHAVARQRMGAYMRNVVMKYIDNLLDWGDQEFALDTRESINEATLLYVMASDLLGERPVELGDCEEKSDDGSFNIDPMFQPQNSIFQQVLESVSVPNSGGISNSMTVSSSSMESAERTAELSPEGFSISWGGSDDVSAVIDIPGHDFRNDNPPGIAWKARSSSEESPDMASFATSLLQQASSFCIPLNPDLLAYWDRVQDRLYKIRNCLNLSGIRRDLPLFAPETDPRLLVRAKAAGISLDDVLSSINGNLPPYRFSYLIAKAKEYAGALQSYGGALLATLEKQDAEELSAMRLRHQTNIMKLTSRQRDLDVNAAEESLEALLVRKEGVNQRLQYYSALLEVGLTGLEDARDALYYFGHAAKIPGVPFMLAAGGASMSPSILGFSFSTPTNSIKNFFEAASIATDLSGKLNLLASDMVGKHAGYERRDQGWEFSRDQTKEELAALEKQIVVSGIRRDIAIQARELHEINIENLEETYAFYRDRFTNRGLYTWLSTQLQRLYREAYQSIISVARLAEQAYRFERNDDVSTLLDNNYWDASRAGLMAGERILNDLRSMELRFMETNSRSMEIDQAFSLTQIDPAALITLKETGECEFDIPELYIYLFYPGLCRCLIKSARLTIPCITGPYTNVSAILSLTSSEIRKEPKTGDENLSIVPPSRTTTIATSTAQNDSGVFNLDFRDERYMPFEGAGAISSWNLKLPKTFKPFDYSTINDVILHISYTAEYDETLRSSVEEEMGSLEALLKGGKLYRVFSLRQEFSQSFHSFLHNPLGESTNIEISEKHFPIFLQGKTLSISSASLILATESIETAGDSSPAITIFRDEGTEEEISSGDFSVDDKFGGLRSAVIPSILSGNINPGTEPITISFSVTNAGGLAPDTPAPSDQSAIDDHKLSDLYVYIEYSVV
ncbi:MAG: neuraminidase-like domain-containing protein [Methylococcaceae bacterium]